MKLFTVALLSVISHIQCMSDHQKELLKRWHMECFEETHVNPDLIIQLKAGDWQLNNTLLKKWTLCLLRKYGLMSDQGVFRMDNALSMVPNKAINPLLTDLRTRRGETNENTDEENDVLGMALFIASFFFFL